MRHPLTVHIPQNKDVSYSLYAAGQKAEKPYLLQDESEYVFKFSGGTAVVLFYTFERIKRAYIVTGWQDAHDGEPVALPGVDGTLALVYMTKGSKFRLLDGIIKELTKGDEHFIFSLPLLFWYRLSNIIQYKGGRKSAVQNLIESYKTEGKSRYYE